MTAGKPTRIVVLCPSTDRPSGGVRKLYRHVDVLNAHGFNAVLAHRQAGFRCQWFPHDTPVAYPPEIWPPKAGDVVVVPETLAWEIVATTPGVRKVIFNQNPYETFLGRTDPNMPVPYTHPDVLATLVVSEDSVRFMNHVFPGHVVHRIHNAVNPALFFPGQVKRRQIVYMPRKARWEADQVKAILQCRGALRDFELVLIENRTEAQTAAILRESAIFLSFSVQDGFALPPVEAVACGCVVVGYHGLGGREYLRPPFAIPVPQQDLLTFAQSVESVINQLNTDPTPLVSMSRQAAQLVRDRYSPGQEESDIIGFWTALFSSAAPVRGA